MSSSSPERTPFDTLSAPDGVSYLLGDQPFTGTAYELDPEGRLSCEIEFRDGARCGTTRTWNPETGQLLSELRYFDTKGSSLLREWHDQPFFDPEDEDLPVLAREREAELGIIVSERRWDQAGELIEDFLLTPDNPQFGILEGFRRAFGKNQV